MTLRPPLFLADDVPQVRYARPESPRGHRAGAMALLTRPAYWCANLQRQNRFTHRRIIQEGNGD